MDLGKVSFWYADIGMPTPRAPLAGDLHADICIIGAGFTGLWAAHYLTEADPTLKIVIVDKNFAGFGASGRNGGWLTGEMAWPHEKYAKTHGQAATRDMVSHLAATVDEVIAVAEHYGIDADICRTQELTLATNPAHMVRLDESLHNAQMWEARAPRTRKLGADAARNLVRVPDVLGALAVSGVARIHPGKLVQGLAAALAAKGVTLAEQTCVHRLEPGRVETDRGVVSAGTVLRATEGFTAALPQHRRDWVPLNSAQIVTPVLPDEIWQEIGWQGRELIGDFNNVYCYCQRTREGRIMVGGRGTPYRWGSAIDDNGRPDAGTVKGLQAILQRYFPAAVPFGIDHAWCGVLGVPRDWCATVGFDTQSRIGWAGGYVGVGVSTSNLAGRTLADLALGRDTARARLPWVNRKVRRWEPEPLRWLGIRGMYGLLHLADRQEARGRATPSPLARLGYWLAGR